uniref:Eukaryotic translation initiation factor 4C n=6 Tax=Paniceae TaxID=147428 RepID=K3YVM0_SETIT
MVVHLQTSMPQRCCTVVESTSRRPGQIQVSRPSCRGAADALAAAHKPFATKFPTPSLPCPRSIHARVSSRLSPPAMPKNKGKGGKNRKRGKNEADDEKRELVFKEDGQEYAQVTRMLGNGRCEALCIDGTKRLCHIRGKMHKKVWIAAGDIVLVGLRDYQDDKADVILKYMNDEARLLKAYGEIPDNVRLNEGVVDEEDTGAQDDYIQFEDEDIDKI